MRTDSVSSPSARYWFGVTWNRAAMMRLLPSLGMTSLFTSGRRASVFGSQKPISTLRPRTGICGGMGISNSSRTVSPTVHFEVGRVPRTGAWSMLRRSTRPSMSSTWTKIM